MVGTGEGDELSSRVGSKRLVVWAEVEDPWEAAKQRKDLSGGRAGRELASPSSPPTSFLSTAPNGKTSPGRPCHYNMPACPDLGWLLPSQLVLGTTGRGSWNFSSLICKMGTMRESTSKRWREGSERPRV